MPFLTDFASAITGYPAASVTLTIGSLVVQPPGTTPAVNINEVWAFKITVHNNGDLNMKNVTLHYSGLNGVAVSAAAGGPFSSSGILLTTTPIASVPAHGSATTANLFFKAPAAPSIGVVDLIDVHLNGWDADFLYLQNNLSGHANPPDVKLPKEVFP
jgi:uncharacterized repeat protein (TIGR01451 family)